MAIGYLTSDYVAFVFNNPIEEFGMCAQLASFPVALPQLPPGVGSLAPSVYTAIPSSRGGSFRSNFWRIRSPTGGSFVITQRAANDPSSYPSAPTVFLDTYMYLWNNTKTSMLASNDDGGGSGTSQISYFLTAGVYYLIECSSWNSGVTWSYKVQCYRSSPTSDVTGTVITSV